MLLENPLWLWGLLVIPPVIWLAWRSKRPMHQLVSSIILWRKMPGAEAPTPRRWQWILLLICYVLFIALLALALAQPQVYITQSRPRHIVILLDSSASMSSVVSGTNQTRWDLAVQKLEVFISQLPNQDKVSIFHSQGSIREVDKEAAIKDLQVMPSAMIAHNFNEFIRQVAPAVNTAGKQGQIVFVICSDKMPYEGVISLLPVKPLFVLVGEPSNNKAIIQANSTPAPGKSGLIDIFAMVKNYSRTPVELPVELYTSDGKLINNITANIPAGGKLPVIFPDMPTTGKAYWVRLKVDDELTADNEALVRAGEDRLSVCLTGVNNEAVLKALRAVGNAGGVDYTPEISGTVKYDLFIFNNARPEALPEYSVIINPSVNTDAKRQPLVASAGVITPTGIIVIDEASPLFRHVSFDNIHIRKAAQLTIYDKEHFRPLVKSGDDVLIGEFRKGGKYCLVIGFDVEWNKDSNWSLTPSFPIFWANVINYFNSQRTSDTNISKNTSGLCDEAESDNAGEMRDDLTPELASGRAEEQTAVNIGAFLVIAAGCLLAVGWLAESRTI